jgi:F-type H+-transporting ATPase subunit alpha
MHSYFQTNFKDLRDKINASGDYDKEIEAGLKKAVEEFKKTQAW